MQIIPDELIIQAKSDLRIAYNHTSHGGEIITEMNALYDFLSFGSKYSWGSSMNDISILSWADKGIPAIAEMTSF